MSAAMEIAAPPGTAMILEPGGLDAPASSANEHAEEHQPREENAGANEEPKEDQQQNRVIVRRRVTRGGGFFARKDAVAPSGGGGRGGAGREGVIGAVGPAAEPGAVDEPNEAEAEQIGPGRRVSRVRVTGTVVVKPGYSSLRTGIIKLTPESMKCKLYCRGAKCIYCSHDQWTDAQQAIRGLYSHWINEDILASARPTVRTFEDFDLIGQFKKAKIRTVFNLQCSNEHDFCGPPLVPHSGFSYDPELLMRNKIFFYNFAMPDFGTASAQSILNIVKVIWFSLRHGRVAIHCHAGLGRTGTLIACFLVWSKGLFTSDAIDLVREARPNSVQSVEQINMVEEFAYHVHKYGTALPSAFYSANTGISLRQLMFNQRQFLPNDEARQFTHIPKLLFMVGDRLLRFVFEQEGIYYAPPNGHHARSCTFGTICVNWRNAFTVRGKLQVRQVVNFLARCSAFPYEKDQALINRFQQLSLVTVEQLIVDMDVPQLVSLLNAFMESIRKPYCSRRALIEALGNFSPENPTGPIPDSDDEDEQQRAAADKENLDKADMELVNQLVNPRGSASSEKGEGEGEAVAVGGLLATAGTNAKSEKEDEKSGAIEEHAEKEEVGQSTEEIEPEGKEVIGSAVLQLNGEEEKEEKDGETSAAAEGRDDKNGEEAGIGQQNGANNNGETAAADDEMMAVVVEAANGNHRRESAFQGILQRHSLTMEKCAQRYGGIATATAISAQGEGEHQQKGYGTIVAVENVVERPTTTGTTSSSVFAPTASSLDFGAFQFDNHDSHTNKEVNLSADWQCIVFYVCNMLSYLTGENYDAVLDLLTFWFTGDGNRDVRQAIYCHMRDLFARNMRQQEQQAAEWRRRMGLPERGATAATTRTTHYQHQRTNKKH